MPTTCAVMWWSLSNHGTAVSVALVLSCDDLCPITAPRSASLLCCHVMISVQSRHCGQRRSCAVMWWSLSNHGTAVSVALVLSCDDLCPITALRSASLLCCHVMISVQSRHRGQRRSCAVMWWSLSNHCTAVSVALVLSCDDLCPITAPRSASLLCCHVMISVQSRHRGQRRSCAVMWWSLSNHGTAVSVALVLSCDDLCPITAPRSASLLCCHVMISVQSRHRVQRRSCAVMWWSLSNHGTAVSVALVLSCDDLCPITALRSALLSSVSLMTLTEPRYADIRA